MWEVALNNKRGCCSFVNLYPNVTSLECILPIYFNVLFYVFCYYACCDTYSFVASIFWVSEYTTYPSFCAIHQSNFSHVSSWKVLFASLDSLNKLGNATGHFILDKTFAILAQKFQRFIPMKGIPLLTDIGIVWSLVYLH